MFIINKKRPLREINSKSILLSENVFTKHLLHIRYCFWVICRDLLRKSPVLLQTVVAFLAPNSFYIAFVHYCRCIYYIGKINI